MSEELKQLLEEAKRHESSPQEREEQRRSFAYGNTNIENSRVTREIVDEQAQSLAADRG